LPLVEFLCLLCIFLRPSECPCAGASDHSALPSLMLRMKLIPYPGN
jgi:hypothetical protein